MALVYTITRIACSNGLDLDTPKAKKLPYLKRTKSYLTRTRSYVYRDYEETLPDLVVDLFSICVIGGLLICSLAQALL